MRILAISGSLRSKSSNRALLLVAKGLASQYADITIYDELAELPHFNPDLDIEPLPSVVLRLRKLVSDSDALLIASPEYAHGVTGVLKNLLDWLVSALELEGKPVGIMFGSASGASYARASLLEILKTMSVRVIPGAVVSVPGARTQTVTTKSNPIIFDFCS